MYNLEKDKDSYFRLGRIIKTYGYKGELVMTIDAGDPASFASLEVIFISIDSSLVPWFIAHIGINGDRALMKLHDIDSPDKAQELVMCEVFLPIGKLPPLSDKRFYFHEVEGFRAVDRVYGDIGLVEEILDRPEQKIVRIMFGKKEILVPLTDEIIMKVDRKRKVLHLDTPPGLIDLYID
jgi:16S rRNA processing protein RimM